MFTSRSIVACDEKIRADSVSLHKPAGCWLLALRRVLADLKVTEALDCDRSI